MLRRISVAAAITGIFGMGLLPHAPHPMQTQPMTITLAEVHLPFTHVAWHPGAQADVQGIHPDQHVE